MYCYYGCRAGTISSLEIVDTASNYSNELPQSKVHGDKKPAINSPPEKRLHRDSTQSSASANASCVQHVEDSSNQLQAGSDHVGLNGRPTWMCEGDRDCTWQLDHCVYCHTSSLMLAVL